MVRERKVALENKTEESQGGEEKWGGKKKSNNKRERKNKYNDIGTDGKGSEVSSHSSRYINI